MSMIPSYPRSYSNGPRYRGGDDDAPSLMMPYQPGTPEEAEDLALLQRLEGRQPAQSALAESRTLEMRVPLSAQGQPPPYEQPENEGQDEVADRLRPAMKPSSSARAAWFRDQFQGAGPRIQEETPAAAVPSDLDWTNVSRSPKPIVPGVDGPEPPMNEQEHQPAKAPVPGAEHTSAKDHRKDDEGSKEVRPLQPPSKNTPKKAAEHSLTATVRLGDYPAYKDGGYEKKNSMNGTRPSAQRMESLP